jgi:hypothetical protein
MASYGRKWHVYLKHLGLRGTNSMDFVGRENFSRHTLGCRLSYISANIWGTYVHIVSGMHANDFN